jgi:hypothetical protein
MDTITDMAKSIDEMIPLCILADMNRIYTMRNLLGTSSQLTVITKKDIVEYYDAEGHKIIDDSVIKQYEHDLDLDKLGIRKRISPTPFIPKALYLAKYIGDIDEKIRSDKILYNLVKISFLEAKKILCDEIIPYFNNLSRKNKHSEEKHFCINTIKHLSETKTTSFSYEIMIPNKDGSLSTSNECIKHILNICKDCIENDKVYIEKIGEILDSDKAKYIFMDDSKNTIIHQKEYGRFSDTIVVPIPPSRRVGLIANGDEKDICVATCIEFRKSKQTNDWTIMFNIDHEFQKYLTLGTRDDLQNFIRLNKYISGQLTKRYKKHGKKHFP